MFFLFAMLELSKFFAKINNFKSTNINNIYVWILLYIFFALPIERSFLYENFCKKWLEKGKINMELEIT